MRYFNFHAHLTTTTLGEAYDAEQLVKDMTALGVERVGISNLLLPTTKEKNDLIYEAKCKYPEMIRSALLYAYRLGRNRIQRDKGSERLQKYRS